MRSCCWCRRSSLFVVSADADLLSAWRSARRIAHLAWSWWTIFVPARLPSLEAMAAHCRHLAPPLVQDPAGSKSSRQGPPPGQAPLFAKQTRLESIWLTTSCDLTTDSSPPFEHALCYAATASNKQTSARAVNEMKGRTFLLVFLDLFLIHRFRRVTFCSREPISVASN